MNDNGLSYIDLFAGAGGLSEGFIQSGYRPIAHAFIEINSRIKKLYKIVNPENDRIPDGVEAMNKVFSPNNPVIMFADITTDTGRNIQQGYMQMFAGAIAALRNPKAHENILLDREECKKRLVFASMLMDKIDEGVRYTGISEDNSEKA